MVGGILFLTCLSVSVVNFEAYMNGDIPLEKAAIFFSIKSSSKTGYCLGYVIVDSFAWAYSTCEEHELRITKWKILQIWTWYVLLSKRTHLPLRYEIWYLSSTEKLNVFYLSLLFKFTCTMWWM